jgi:hypothetical protein
MAAAISKQGPRDRARRPRAVKCGSNFYEEITRRCNTAYERRHARCGRLGTRHLISETVGCSVTIPTSLRPLPRSVFSVTSFVTSTRTRLGRSTTRQPACSQYRNFSGWVMPIRRPTRGAWRRPNKPDFRARLSVRPGPFLMSRTTLHRNKTSRSPMPERAQTRKRKSRRPCGRIRPRGRLVVSFRANRRARGSAPSSPEVQRLRDEEGHRYRDVASSTDEPQSR